MLNNPDKYIAVIDATGVKTKNKTVRVIFPTHEFVAIPIDTAAREQGV